MASGRAHKLSALDVKRASKPGKYGDGNCLYLVVTESGAKHWLLRLVIRGKRRDMGLGSADLISLDEARDSTEDLLALAVIPFLSAKQVLGSISASRKQRLKSMS